MKIILVAALAAAGAALSGVVAHAGPSGSTIRVTEREFRIALSSTHTPAGRVRLEIENTGRYPHALAIKGAGLSARTKLIRPGKSAVLLVTLKHGSYALWCPIPGHAAQGMRATLVISTTAPSGGATSTGTTSSNTTTTGGGYPY